LPFDYLVIALGAELAPFGLKRRILGAIKLGRKAYGVTVVL
jgi:hypothetical protein